MNKLFPGLIIVLISVFVGVVFFSCNTEKKIKVLVVTGGHDYDKEGFEELLAKLPGSYDQVEHPNALAMLNSEKFASYDVVLFYDMPLKSESNTAVCFYELTDAGKGIIVLHHAFCSYNAWPEYERMIGGSYYRYPWKKDGVAQDASTYTHDVTFDVKVEDPNHPVTEGVSDFQITDETYGNVDIMPNVYPLLSTTEPSSALLVGWTNIYRNSRVVTLTLGHDRSAWENPSFIQILSQAVKWTAENDKTH
ncbi:MAG: ThuA domain-containing protein [Tannerella sp.]|jgi:type 1 glutamine amidotransferase|nr:ThuA domain-containing protein [Tannerella sp.]